VIDINDINKARELLAGQVLHTPTILSPALSNLTGAEVYLKLENQQVTGSFKVRGSYVRMSSLSEAERGAGVIAASAGNHAQGVGYHAQRLGIPAAIYMPANTPFTKVARTEALGATVILEGESVAESRILAMQAAEAEGKVFIHPYDDPHVIAGQGTATAELLEDVPDLDVIVVPIGGGGLAAGCCIAAAAHNPALEVVGAQADAYPSMYQAFKGEPPHGRGATIADGIAVKEPGEMTTPILKAHMNGVAVVTEADIERAVQVFVDVQRLIVEGSGAVPLALMLAERERFKGRKVGLMVSGGNIDSRLLSSVLMRGLVRDGRLAKLRITLIDMPGALAAVAGIIGDKGGNIVDVLHQRMFRDVPVKEADVDIAIETIDADHVREIMAALEAAGFGTRLLSDMR
jgi:threonine dehydratase